MHRALLACVIFVSCGNSGSAPDAPMCDDLRLRADTLVATLDTACTTIDDCVLVGAAEGCGCSPSFLGSGRALSKTGAANAELQGLVAQFATCLNREICDAGRASLSCDAHHCTATAPTCLPTQPDAGPCSAGVEVPCGDRVCRTGEFCTLDWPGAASAPPDGGCPAWCFAATQVNGCLCPTAQCQHVAGACQSCDCALPDNSCPGPGWQCSCTSSGGIVLSCYHP